MLTFNNYEWNIVVKLHIQTNSKYRSVFIKYSQYKIRHLHTTSFQYFKRFNKIMYTHSAVSGWIQQNPNPCLSKRLEPCVRNSQCHHKFTSDHYLGQRRYATLWCSCKTFNLLYNCDNCTVRWITMSVG